MPYVFSTKQLFFLFSTLVILFTLLSACSQHPKKNRQSIKTQPPLVEQQLLATIKNAENLEEGNPLLLSSLYSLASFYHDRKEYDKAVDQYQRALHIKERMSGPNHPDVAAILQRYARVLQEAKRPTQAANLLARADAILAQSNPAASTQ
jgi:tetratricopeptide (TPR) repeat protein